MSDEWIERRSLRERDPRRVSPPPELGDEDAPPELGRSTPSDEEPVVAPEPPSQLGDIPQKPGHTTAPSQESPFVALEPPPEAGDVIRQQMEAPTRMGIPRIDFDELTPPPPPLQEEKRVEEEPAPPPSVPSQPVEEEPLPLTSKPEPPAKPIMRLPRILVDEEPEPEPAPEVEPVQDYRTPTDIRPVRVVPEPEEAPVEAPEDMVSVPTAPSPQPAEIGMQPADQEEVVDAEWVVEFSEVTELKRRSSESLGEWTGRFAEVTGEFLNGEFQIGRWRGKRLAVLLVAVALIALVIFVPVSIGLLTGGEPTPEVTSPPGTVTQPTPLAEVLPTGLPTPTVTPLPPYAQGRMAFASNLDGDFEIYVLDMQTGALTQLTDNDYDDHSPAWSPDGTRLVYVADRAGDDDLYVMDAYGRNIMQLTTSTDADRSPAWSPDGQTVVFSREKAGAAELFTFAAGCLSEPGACEEALIPFSTDRYDLFPTWSPDGSRIAFTTSSGPGMPSVIALLNPDRTGYKTLNGTGSSDFFSVWSPDGARLCFVSYAKGDYDLWLMSSTGGDVIQLTQQESEDVEPAWSPDGAFIVFASDRGQGDFELFLIRSNCTSPEEGCEADLVQLTDNSADDLNPAWIR